MVPFGVRPVGVRASVAIGKREGLVACADRGTRGALRLHPMSIRAVTPSLAHEGASRMIIAVDGQALGPRVARDDDVYLVWRGTMRSATELVRPKAPCPEARWTDERVVVCIDPALVRGRGPARVRVQAAGRLEEAAGTAVDLDRALGAVPSAP